MATASAVQWGIVQSASDANAQTGTSTYSFRDHNPNLQSIAAFTFRFNGSTALAQGSTVASTYLTIRQNNAILANSTHSENLYVAVENNLQGGPGNAADLTTAIPTGTGGASRVVQKRLSADSGAQAIWGNRTGLTHNGDLANDSPASPIDSRAYVYHATAGRGASTAGTDLTTDNFSGALQALVNDSSWNSTDQYVTVFLFWQATASNTWDWERYPMTSGLTWASGQSGSDNAQTITGGQIVMSVTPTLDFALGYTNWEPSIDGDGANVEAEVTQSAWVGNTNIPYYGVSALGTAETAGTYRFLDLYTPAGGAPTGGWPVIVFIHGGRWITGSKSIGASENNISQGFVNKMTEQGYSVVSVEYRKMQETLNPNAIVNSFPRNMHDIYASLKWVETNAGTYNLNEEKVVISGHSAGGYLAAFAGVVANTGDSATYNGSQSSSGDRPAGYGYSDTASPWQFDLDEFGELSVSNPPVGIMLWDAPIDVFQATIIADPAGTANAQARKALMGEVINQPVYAGEDEADLNHYIAGDGTIYTSAQSSSNIPPIFFMYSTTQDLVTNASSITAINDALNTIGYDVSTGSGVLNTNGGLTRHAVARDHADVLRDQAPNFTEEIAWLNEVAPATTPNTHYVGTTAISKMYLGSTEITKAYLGSTEIWP